jgi:hypothetical protein
MKNRFRWIAFACVAFWLCGAFGVYAMQSSNYKILWDSINTGGDDVSSSTSYFLHDTIGEMGTGTSTDGTTTLSAGYRVGDPTDSFLDFTIGTQVNATKVVWTNFSNAGKSVDVTSKIGYAVGEYIGVVENQGGDQLVAVGKIISIVGNTFTVDAWSGNPAGISAVASGGDDFVYRLSGTTADLGRQSALLVSTSITQTNVYTNATSGYAVRIIADGDLRTATALKINNLTGGAVTAGTEAYGSRVTGALGVGTGTDLAISSSTSRTIQLSSTTSTNDRVAFIYKLGIATSTLDGSYGQQVSFMATANY